MGNNKGTIFMVADIDDGLSVLEVCARDGEHSVKIHSDGETKVVELDMPTLLRLASVIVSVASYALEE